MNRLNLLSNNRKLSDNECKRAKSICNECLGYVIGREQYIESNGLDRLFALPDANWSYEAPNDFVALFKRIVQANPADLNILRGFSQVFSGYSLFDAEEGAPASKIKIDDLSDEKMSAILEEKNWRYVDENLDLVRDIPEAYVFRPPNMLGEIGHLEKGRIINNDVNTYQERVNLLWFSGILDFLHNVVEKKGEVKILEIGGGYGAIAYWVKSVFPNASYTIVDLPESILFSRLYLELTRPDLSQVMGVDENKFGFRFVPNFMCESFFDSFDLVINTLSMSEMSEYQVRKYACYIKDRWLVDDGLFFEQNQNNHHIGLRFAKEILAQEFSFCRELRKERGVYRNGYPNIWSNKEITLMSRTEFDSKVVLLEDCGEFNLVQAGECFWLFAKHLGAIDPFLLLKRDFDPVIYYGSSAEEVKKKARISSYCNS